MLYNYFKIILIYFLSYILCKPHSLVLRVCITQKWIQKFIKSLFKTNYGRKTFSFFRVCYTCRFQKKKGLDFTLCKPSVMAKKANADLYDVSFDISVEDFKMETPNCLTILILLIISVTQKRSIVLRLLIEVTCLMDGIQVGCQYLFPCK